MQADEERREALVDLGERGRLESLEARGYLSVEVDDRRVRASLAHPLYGEVLRRQLAPLRERRFLRELADRLEAHGARRREDVTQLAMWRLEGGGAVDPEVVLGAGRLALAARDTTLAARFAAAAAQNGAPHDAARIAVEAALLASAADDAEAAVASVWDDDLSDELRSHLARRLAAARFGGGDLAGALDALDRALEQLTDPEAIAAVKVERVVHLASSGRSTDVLAELDGLDGVADPRLRSAAASARSRAEAVVGRLDAAIASARAGAQAQRELPEWIAHLGAVSHVTNEVHALAVAGRLLEARDLASDALASADGPATTWIHLALGGIERDAGDGRAALTHYDAVIDQATRFGQHACLVWARTGIAQSHLLLGELEQADVALAEADRLGASPLASSDELRERARAWLLAGRGDLPGARRLVVSAADQIRDGGGWAVEVGLQHDLVRLGDPAAAIDRLAGLAAIVDGPFVTLALEHARVATRSDAAGYPAVVDGFESLGLLVAAAEAAAELADLHRRAGDGRAATAADQRVARLVERTGARTPALRRGAGIDPLTGREREVALLAAGGAASKAIAAQLHLSARTVDTHLARVYRKLGVGGRDELAAALDGALGTDP